MCQKINLLNIKGEDVLAPVTVIPIVNRYDSSDKGGENKTRQHKNQLVEGLLLKIYCVSQNVLQGTSVILVLRTFLGAGIVLGCTLLK